MRASPLILSLTFGDALVYTSELNAIKTYYHDMAQSYMACNFAVQSGKVIAL